MSSDGPDGAVLDAVRVNVFPTGVIKRKITPLMPLYTSFTVAKITRNRN
jgi:hypothetical protein